MRYTKDQIQRHICTILDTQGLSFTLPLREEDTLESLGLDSLDLAELVVQVEELYGVTFDDEGTPIRAESSILEVIDDIYDRIVAKGVQKMDIS